MPEPATQPQPSSPSRYLTLPTSELNTIMTSLEERWALLRSKWTSLTAEVEQILSSHPMNWEAYRAKDEEGKRVDEEMDDIDREMNLILDEQIRRRYAGITL